MKKKYIKTNRKHYMTLINNAIVKNTKTVFYEYGGKNIIYNYVMCDGLFEGVMITHKFRKTLNDNKEFFKYILK